MEFYWWDTIAEEHIAIHVWGYFPEGGNFHSGTDYWVFKFIDSFSWMSFCPKHKHETISKELARTQWYKLKPEIQYQVMTKRAYYLDKLFSEKFWKTKKKECPQELKLFYT